MNRKFILIVVLLALLTCVPVSGVQLTEDWDKIIEGYVVSSGEGHDWAWLDNNFMEVDEDYVYLAIDGYNSETYQVYVIKMDRTDGSVVYDVNVSGNNINLFDMEVYNGKVYLCGRLQGDGGLFVTTADAFDTVMNDVTLQTGFLTILGGSGEVEYGTYIDGNGNDAVTSIETEGGYVYMVVDTGSSNLLLSADPYDGVNGLHNYTGYIAKLDLSEVGASQLKVGTYMGNDIIGANQSFKLEVSSGEFFLPINVGLVKFNTGGTSRSLLNENITPDWQGGLIEIYDGDIYFVNSKANWEDWAIKIYVLNGEGTITSEETIYESALNEREQVFKLVVNDDYIILSGVSSGNIEATEGAYIEEYGENYDGLVILCDREGNVLYKTYIGGTEDYESRAVAGMYGDGMYVNYLGSDSTMSAALYELAFDVGDSSCGDSECNGEETCETCEADCGACPVDEYCGDNICNADETCSNCSHDCGSCGSPNPPDPIDEEEITYGYFRSYPFQISNLQEYILGLELSTTKNHTEKFRLDVLDSNNKLIYSKEFSKYLGKEASVDLKIKLGNKSYEPGLGTLRLVEVDTDEVLDQEIVYLIIEAEDYALYVTRSGQEQIDSSIKEGTITFNEIISIHNYGPGKAEDVEIPVSVFFETLSAYIKSDGKSIEINKEENIISFILEELAPNKDKTYDLTTEEKGIKQEKRVELEGEYFDSNNNECKVYEVTLTNTSEAREVNSNYEWGYYSITEVHVGSMTGDQIEVENEKSVYGFDVTMGPKRTIKVYVYQSVNQEFSSGFNQFFKDLVETIRGIMSSVVFKSASYLALITAAILGGYVIYKKFFKVKGKKKVR